MTTKQWAESLKVPSDVNLSPVPNYTKPYAHTAREVAVRAIILQGVIAVAYGVEAPHIIEWFQAQKVWDAVTSKERSFLNRSQHADSERTQFQWQQEAQGTLLWMIQRVESLGLPTHYCDTRRVADEIIPALGHDLQAFISQSELRSPATLLAEDERTYELWCYALAAQRRREELPSDLNLSVLRERRYAFEWMDGIQEWDEVTCDT